ncbi:hypothetical protein PLESTF_000109100 [Pleodorina starrii]|nr:hypothetical protein PLESTM_001274900 [Pleodorina starrii]GLC64013.1 hypothetical protein PLESTF_000109100 [Pleodorina starrii]
MPSFPSQRQRPPSSGPATAGGNLGSGGGSPQLRPGRAGRGGLYDSPEREPPAARRGPAPAPLPDHNRPLAGAGGSFDPAGDGRGGLAGLRDPYDRPTRSQLKGAQSRLRQDKASGALDEVAGRHRVLFGAHQLVRKGLRRSIADAYAAYVGQVVNLPEDSYGLALRALDRTFNSEAGARSGQPPGVLDGYLHTTPFATSRAKRAQIFNTAHKIMRDLGGYVYDVSYYCPGELDQLREMRRPGAVPAGESYKSGPRLATGEPPLGREAVAAARRPSSAPSGRGRRAGQRPLMAPLNPAISPISGAIRQPGRATDLPGQTNATKPQPQQQQQRRPKTAASGAGAGGAALAAAAVARSVAVALDTAAAAEAAEHGGVPELLDPLEDQQRRDLRRRSSPAMFTKTPPHLRVSKFYDHVSPTQEMMEIIRQRTQRAAQEQAERAAERAAAAAAAAAADAAASAGSGREAMQPAAAVAPRSAVQPGSRMGGSGSGAAGPPPRQGAADAPAAAAAAAAGRHASGGGVREGKGGSEDPDPAGTARILWIIETAYELGLAEVLGLEGPPPYPRSERLHPRDHRRQFYEAVYSSPERYAPYVPYAPPVNMQGVLGPVSPAVAPGDGYDSRGGHGYDDASPGRMGAGGAGWPYQYDGRTAQRIEMAAERRYVRETAPVSEAKLYPRSRRVRPH